MAILAAVLLLAPARSTDKVDDLAVLEPYTVYDRTSYATSPSGPGYWSRRSLTIKGLSREQAEKLIVKADGRGLLGWQDMFDVDAGGEFFDDELVLRDTTIEIQNGEGFDDLSVTEDHQLDMLEVWRVRLTHLGSIPLES